MPTPIACPRVLVVDDDRGVLMTVVRMLRALGADAVPALGGRTALTFLESMDPPPDLILTDIQMPGLDGEELLRRIRADETFGTIPVVAMTGTGTDQPFDLVLEKPFRDGALGEVARLARGSTALPDQLAALARKLLPPLDALPGPALCLSCAAAAALVRAIVEGMLAARA